MCLEQLNTEQISEMLERTRRKAEQVSEQLCSAARPLLWRGRAPPLSAESSWNSAGLEM